VSGQSAIEQLDAEITREEQHLARVVDRIDAMLELLVAAHEVEKTLDRRVTFDDLLSACETTRDRAKLSSLFDRIAPPAGTGPSGLSEEDTGGHRLDGAERSKRVGGKVLS
jgi:hypothetical protein